jgi:hypothetical protein
VIGILALVAGLAAFQADEPEQSYVFQDVIEAPAYLRTPVQQQELRPQAGFNHALGFLPPEMEPEFLEFHRSELSQTGWHVEERTDDQLYASHDNPENGCLQVFQLRISGPTVTGAGVMRVVNYTLYRSGNCPSFSSNSPNDR